jgi:hypothetical protein
VAEFANEKVSLRVKNKKKQYAYPDESGAAALMKA